MEADQSFFRPGVESPSEMSLVRGTRRKKVLILNNSQNSELSDSGNTGPLLNICLLEEGESGLFGATVAGGARFFMSYMDECSTPSHTWSRGLVDDLPGGKGGAWVVLEPSCARLPSSDFYQKFLSGSTTYKVNNFEGLPLSSYTLDIWGNIFRCLRQRLRKTLCCRLRKSKEKRVKSLRLGSKLFP